MNDSSVGLAGVVVGVMLALSIGGLWGAAWVLGGAAVDVGVADGVTAMVLEGESPAQAWGIGSSTGLYWATVAGFFVIAVVAVGLVMRVLFRKEWGTKSRDRLGSSTEAEFASTRDLETLWSKLEPSGRFLLGRTHGWLGTRFGSKMLSAEWRDDPNKSKLSRAARKRETDRGAVMLIAPSRFGKTVTALTGIHYWDGPVLLSSVKDDLLRPTLGYRRSVGEVAVFDPVDYLTDAYAEGEGRPEAWDERLKVSWSPLRYAGHYQGSARAARALADSGPEQGGQNQMWVDLAEQLLQGLMFVATQSGRGMSTVVGWVMQQDSPGITGDQGEVLGLAQDLLGHPDLRVAEDAAAAFNALQGVWKQDAKIMSSVYVTAMSLINTWLAPSTARSASGPSLDLDWLCAGNNSLYLVADPLDAARQAPVFGGMVTDLIGQAFTRVARTGKPIDPPLLVVLDEAGNLPLERLPQFASTVAGLGVQLVTVWQSLAQVHELYGQRADTVIANHLTKVAYGGISDKSTLDYLSMLVSEEEVETQINSDDKWRWWQGSMQLQGTRLSLAPSHTIRQMPQKHALLIHANLKPAHIHAVPWYESKALLERTKWAPDDERGLPVSLSVAPTNGEEDDWPDFDSLAPAAPIGGPNAPVEQPVMATGDVLGALGLRNS